MNWSLLKVDYNDEAMQHYNTVVCEICGSGENEDSLLLCDGCDKGLVIIIIESFELLFLIYNVKLSKAFKTGY